ncbi:CRISPR-associated protein Cas5 [Rothia dentocariosa]
MPKSVNPLALGFVKKPSRIVGLYFPLRTALLGLCAAAAGILQCAEECR